MSEEKRTYEGMFLLDAGNSDFTAASEPARNVLERIEAEILSIKPWDERRLAYEIGGRRRGLYVLTYFKALPSRIPDLERDCQLDERILRLLVLRQDGISEEVIRTETPAEGSARRAAERKAREEAAAAEKTKPTEGKAAAAPAAEKPKPAEGKAAAAPAAEKPKPAEGEAPAAPAAEKPKPAEAEAAPAEPDKPAGEATPADAPAQDAKPTDGAGQPESP